MKYITILFYAFLISSFMSLLNSCECVNDLDTEKKITPTEFAQNRFYNFNDDFIEVNIYSEDTEIDFSDKEHSRVKYVEYSAGNKNISIKSEGEIVFNSLTYFELNSKNTTIFFGDAVRPKLITLKDNITQNVADKFNLRIVNISNSNIDYEVNQEKYDIIKSQSSEFIELDLNSTLKINDFIINYDGFNNGQEYTYVYSELMTYLID